MIWGLLLGLLLYAALGLAYYVYSSRKRPRWKRPIPNYFSASAYVCPKGYPLLRLTRALQMAETCIIRYGKRWNAGQLGAVCLRAHVIVLSDDYAVDLGGLHARGVSVGHAIWVGRSLSTLAHELVHLCEAVLDKELDAAHTLWEHDGLWHAVRVYEEWLIKQGWEVPHSSYVGSLKMRWKQ